MARSELQTRLETLLGSDKVYFQSPPNIQMEYPCIVYDVDQASTDFADNAPYHYVKRYQVTVMAEDPDSVIPDKIAALPMCIFNRNFASNNLHHNVFLLYF